MTEGENNKIFLPQLVIQRRNYSNRMKKKEREGRIGEREETEREKERRGRTTDTDIARE